MATEFFALGDRAVHLEKGSESGVSVTPLTVPILRGHLKKMADFVALVEPHLHEKPVVVPRTMLEDMLEMKRPPLPPLVGVCRSPVLVPPGRVLSANGYHQDHGLYLNLALG